MRGRSVVGELIFDATVESGTQFFNESNNVALIGDVRPLFDVSGPGAYLTYGSRAELIENQIADAQWRTERNERPYRPLRVSA